MALCFQNSSFEGKRQRKEKKRMITYVICYHLHQRYTIILWRTSSGVLPIRACTGNLVGDGSSFCSICDQSLEIELHLLVYITHLILFLGSQHSKPSSVFYLSISLVVIGGTACLYLIVDLILVIVAFVVMAFKHM